MDFIVVRSIDLRDRIAAVATSQDHCSQDPDQDGILGFIIQNIRAEYFALLCAPRKKLRNIARKATFRFGGISGFSFLKARKQDYGRCTTVGSFRRKLKNKSLSLMTPISKITGPDNQETSLTTT